MARPDTALFQVDVSRETGEVTLLVETGCGLRPVMRWPSTDAFKSFAENLLNIHSRIMSKKSHLTKNRDRSIQRTPGGG